MEHVACMLNHVRSWLYVLVMIQDPSWYSTDYRIYMGSSVCMSTCKQGQSCLILYKLVSSMTPVPNIVQTTVKKHSYWFWRHHLSLLALFKFLKDPRCSFRWVDVHTHALTILLHILNHMEGWEGSRIEHQSSLTNRMDARRQYL
jgi:hypothetical protein